MNHGDWCVMGACGTILGAGSVRGRPPDLDVKLSEANKLSCRFSCRAVVLGTSCSANASATRSGPSPSKNLAIAIY